MGAHWYWTASETARMLEVWVPDPEDPLYAYDASTVYAN